MVALLGFFKEREILVEHALLGERHAVHSHKLIAFLVAAPICACETHNLHSLDRCGTGDVRTAAKVGKRTLRIGGDVAVFKLGDKFALIFLVAVAEELQSVVLRYVGTHYCLVLLGKLKHLGFDFCEIVGCELVVTRVDIVVETILNGRADTELHAGIQLLQRLGKEVSRAVPECVLAFGVFPFEKFDSRIGVDRTGKVPLLVIYR